MYTDVYMSSCSGVALPVCGAVTMLMCTSVVLRCRSVRHVVSNLATPPILPTMHIMHSNAVALSAMQLIESQCCLKDVTVHMRDEMII